MIKAFLIIIVSKTKLWRALGQQLFYLNQNSKVKYCSYINFLTFASYKFKKLVRFIKDTLAKSKSDRKLPLQGKVTD